MRNTNTIGSFDTVIVGGGILGLWAAHYAIGEGRSVCVLEKERVGSGASGGVLGALMGHIPDGWNTKKEFQYNALDGLEGKIAQLQEQSGVDCGYRRCGRISVLHHGGMVDHVESWLRGAHSNWRGKYEMDYYGPGDDWFATHHWPTESNAPFGASYDNFAARISPLGVVNALASFVRLHGGLMEGACVTRINPDENRLVLEDGSVINAGEIVVANGVDAYRMLEPFMGAANENEPLGRGVVGQAMLLDFNHDDELPILYRDGVYIVPQQNNRMAIGSTSRNVALGDINSDTYRFDLDNMGFYARAMELAPMLKNAPVVAQWAGVRPRNTLVGRGADPWFEPVPGHDNLIALIGGFKITFGIAHCAMDVARGVLEGPRRSKLSWVQ